MLVSKRKLIAYLQSSIKNMLFFSCNILFHSTLSHLNKAFLHGVVAPAFNPTTWEAEASWFLWVWDQDSQGRYTEKPCLCKTKQQQQKENQKHSYTKIKQSIFLTPPCISSVFYSKSVQPHWLHVSSSINSFISSTWEL